jgi:2-desacetyl-2-hydroxyethyl bacteriochlorophyllide A dehydrogenase
MRAAVLVDVGRLAIEDRPVPVLGGPDDVMLEVECCGICGTDLQILSVPPGHPATVGVVLGHEFVGTVVDAGEHVTSLRPGDRVVVAVNVSCGHCIWCRRGLVNHCENFTTHGIFADGGLAARVVVPARTCYPISSQVPSHVAALAEPLSTVVNGVRLADAFPGEIAVVIGAGPIGLMFAALLRAAGATVLSVEPASLRAEAAASMGADRVVAPEEALQATEELTDGLGADVVVDAVGSQFAVALDLVRKAGRIVLFGIRQQEREQIAQARITRDELTVLGGYVGRPESVFPTAVRILEQRRPDLEPLVTHRVSLDELPLAIEELRAGRAIKVQVGPPV